MYIFVLELELSITLQWLRVYVVGYQFSDRYFLLFATYSVYYMVFLKAVDFKSKLSSREFFQKTNEWIHF